MSFSQNNEQQLILDYFGNYKGVFADFGSNDGITLSNTHQLALNGWEGICVEPSLEAYKRLEFNYRDNDNVVLFNCAATAKHEGTIKFFEGNEHLGKGDVALLSTVNEKELERWKGSNNQFKETYVKALPINKIIKDSGHNKIDFISMDVEGSELELLSVLDLVALQTRLICVEWNSRNQEKFDEIIIPQGFNLIYKNAENLIYGRK